MSDELARKVRNEYQRAIAPVVGGDTELSRKLLRSLDDVLAENIRGLAASVARAAPADRAAQMLSMTYDQFRATVGASSGEKAAITRYVTVARSVLNDGNALMWDILALSPEEVWKHKPGRGARSGVTWGTINTVKDFFEQKYGLALGAMSASYTPKGDETAYTAQDVLAMTGSEFMSSHHHDVNKHVRRYVSAARRFLAKKNAGEYGSLTMKQVLFPTEALPGMPCVEDIPGVARVTILGTRQYFRSRYHVNVLTQ